MKGAKSKFLIGRQRNWQINYKGKVYKKLKIMRMKR